MPRVVTLGTSAALPGDTREFTFLLVEGEREAYLVDCAGSPQQRLLQAGLALEKLQGIFVTHYHPDHIYGLPVLLTGLWLSGRRQPLHMYGPEQSVQVLQALGEVFGWDAWPDWLPIVYHGVAEKEHTLVFDSPEFLLTSSPGTHLTVTTLAVRMMSKRTGGSMVYSSDTQPCEAILRLARGADILMHEATGAQSGHSSAAQAGTIARLAGVGSLVLVHYPQAEEAWQLKEQAGREYSGPIEVAIDLASYEF